MLFLDFGKVFRYNLKVKRKELENMSKEELIKLVLGVSSELEDAEARFRKAQEELNAALAEIERLRALSRKERADRFGPRREDVNAFDEAESLDAGGEKPEAGKRGRKPGFEKDLSWYESRASETVHVWPGGAGGLPDGHEEIGREVSYKCVWVRGFAKVVRYVRHKTKAPDGSIAYPDCSADPFQKSVCTPSLAAALMANKFLLGIPYYRQEKLLLAEAGVDRQDMCRWQMRSTELLKPIADLLLERLLGSASRAVYSDETTLRCVLEKKGKCYLWVFCSGFYDHPIYYYSFENGRGHEHPAAVLKGYDGWLETDAWGAYALLDGVKNCYCWAHARRKFFDYLKGLPDAKKEGSVAFGALRMIDALFAREAGFKREGLGPAGIKEARNRPDYLAALAEIKGYLGSFEYEEGSALGNAAHYLLDRWDGFVEYVNNGHVEMSNNISERAIKPFAIDRKNFLFAFSSDGAESSATYFTLQQTARANGLDPEKYVAKCLELCAGRDPKGDYSDLLPWELCKRYDLK